MLVDEFNREINYLRISVTDRCNLRCIYCMPARGIIPTPQGEILSFEQIHKIVSIAVKLGISKIRITGGEPLVRKDLPLLIGKLKTASGLREVTLTTNGVYLSEFALGLKRSGLDRINISLDSLVPERFYQITRGGSLETVLCGIESALESGFSPIKINVVLIKGFNTDELLDFAKLSKARPIQVRFIEYMSTNLSHRATTRAVSSLEEDDNHGLENYSLEGGLFFSALEAKDICSGLGRLRPVDNAEISTARVFRIEGYHGTIGFISPLSQPFCSSCNKLRLTSNGRLRSCLHSADGVDLKKALERGAADDELAMLIKKAVALKPKAHNLSVGPPCPSCNNFSMCQIGG